MPFEFSSRTTILHARHGHRRRSAGKSPLRANQTPRSVVGDAAHHLRGVLVVRRLRDVGAPAGRALSLRELPLAALFAGAVWRFAARDLWQVAVGMADPVRQLFADDAGSHLPARVPDDLLLLRRLLQGV